ncbi:MAG: hypothetical protein AAGF11_53545 [Myxococcota bacterium]
MATTLRFTTHCFAALGLTLCGTACNDLEPIDEGSAPGDAIPPDVQRAFDETCGTAGCHNSSDRAAGLDLSAAAAPSIINGPSSSSLPMVDPGNINGSYLAVKMLETPPEGTTRTGARMPIGGDFENVDNLIILGWIATATDVVGGADSTGGMPMDSSGGDDDSSGGGQVVACGLDDVAPTAENPFDIGMNAGQIPPDVGAALTNNCGCHGVNDSELIGGAPPYTTGRVPIQTIADFQATIGDETAAQIVLGRVEAGTMPPTYYCDLGGGEVITPDDQQLLIDWLNEGAPDATMWMQ